MLRRGEQPRVWELRPKSKAELEPVVTVTTSETGSMTTTGDPSKIRPALGQLAADHLVELQQAVLDSALSAMRPTWLTVTCGSCGATSRVEAPLPDARTWLQGIELLLKEGLGRAPQADEQSSAVPPRQPEDISGLSWTDLSSLAAALLVDELALASQHGGKAVLVEKLRAISDADRRILEEALSEVAVA